MTRIWFLELGGLCWVRFAQLALGRMGSSWSIMESRLLLAALRVVARRKAEDIFHRGGSESRGDDISRLLDWRDVTVVMIVTRWSYFYLMK